MTLIIKDDIIRNDCVNLIIKPKKLLKMNSCGYGSLIIISYSSLEKFRDQLQKLSKYYKHFETVVINEKSVIKHTQIEYVVASEIKNSTDIDILFWDDISEKDMLSFFEIVKKTNRSIICHYLTDDFEVMEMKFELTVSV